MVRTEGLNILIDAGPDIRQQVLRENVIAIDALLLTHAHNDHIGGLDDLRPYFFGNRQPMPCYANGKTRALAAKMFPWIFDGKGRYALAPSLQLTPVRGPFQVVSRYGNPGKVQVTPIRLEHGRIKVLGYRMKRFAYLTDISRVPEAAYYDLKGLDVLVLNALQEKPHPKHLSISEAVAVAQRIGARQTILIHMTHSVLHAETDARLPAGIMLGYDGMQFDVW